jgi:flagellar biosynthesis/type III secretory pathway protein FliH
MGGFVEKWIEKGKEEGLQEGLQRGQQEGLRDAVFDLLLLRFDTASSPIADRLGEITDVETLRQLHLQAATAESLTDFEQYLETL